MAVYMVTWNLNKERGNYNKARQAFIQHLDRYESISDNGLESVRWINSAATANQIVDDLLLKLDNNDRLFVTKVNADQYQGWLHKDIWSWIDARL